MNKKRRNRITKKALAILLALTLLFSAVPFGSVFIPIFMAASFFVELKELFDRLFSFTRITQ